MDDSPAKRDTLPARGLRRGAHLLRLAEDFVSLKARLFQGGRLNDGDNSALARVHRRAMENIAALRAQPSGPPPAAGKGAVGLRNSAVALVAYDAAWPRLFAEEAERIRKRLGPLAAEVHHVGSTSIPGMPAKPMIDMAVVVDPAALPAGLPGLIAAMEDAGYRYYGDFGHHGGHYFSRHAGSLQTYTAQFHASDSRDLAQLLGFRDAARSDPGLFQEYSGVKAALASALGRDRGLYRWYKAHWLNDRLLKDQDPATWGRLFMTAAYPTMIEMGLRRMISGRHPLAVRRPRPARTK